MGLVDKSTFEARGARGGSDSDYTFAMTTCCERVGVIDNKLGDFYWNTETPADSVNLLSWPDCPYCSASNWTLTHLEHPEQVPELWHWARDGLQRPGRRQLLPLSVHIRELLGFCHRVAAPLPPWDDILILNTCDAPAEHDGHWIVDSAALVSYKQFSARFETLLRAGYPWLNLSIHGLHEANLVVGLEVPSEPTRVPPGRTIVNYSGPPKGPAGHPIWTLDLTRRR